MKTRTVLPVLMITACLLFNFHLQSQGVISPEVGVQEHLDTLIPPGLTFTNEQNIKVKLGDLFTKPTILTLVYFDCPGLCSPLLDGVSQVVETMGMELGKDYQIVTISFNYKDTPEKAVQKKNTFLKRHSKAHAKDWFYLTGDSASIFSLVNAVGFKSKKQGNDWIHPAVITIISPKGKITRYLYGVNFLPFDVKMAIIEAGKEQSRPTINRLLQFCFSYDPDGRRYTLAVTKISATIIIFLAVVLFIGLMVRSKKRNK
ncbi:MAG: SCO family protein [Bacteroidota bacterium]|jgi:protein SCO1